MSRTKYSYELKYKTICEVKKGKTINQVVDEFNLPAGGSLLRHWVKRYQHPTELLLNKDFDNEEQYQKKLETRENLHFVEIKQLKEKIKNKNVILERLLREKTQQQRQISKLKFKLYQQEGLKIDNLELKREVKKLLKIVAKLTKEKQKYYDQITTTKMKQEIILEAGKTILRSGSQHG